MTIPIQIELTCPCCQARFRDEYAALVSFGAGGMCADFRTGCAPAHTIWELLLYSCDNCGFTERSVLDWFERPVPEEVRKLVGGDFARRYRDRIPDKDAVAGAYSKFERYARIREVTGGTPFDLGECYLRASWTTGEARCRELAIRNFKRALERTGPVAEAEAPIAAHLAAETARRLGDGREAATLFGTALALAEARPSLSVLRQIIERQRTAPTESPYWATKEPVLDPLSYFHALFLLEAARLEHDSRPERALQIYERVLAICEPAIVRHLSSKIPRLPVEPTNQVAAAIAKSFVEDPRSGFWVDGALIGIGGRVIELMRALEQGTPPSPDRSASRSRAAQLGAGLQAAVGSTGEKQVYRPGRVFRMVSTGIFALAILAMASMLAASTGGLVLRAFHRTAPFWRGTGAVSAAIAAGWVVSLVARRILGRSSGESASGVGTGCVVALAAGLMGVGVAWWVAGGAGVLALAIASLLVGLVSSIAARRQRAPA